MTTLRARIFIIFSLIFLFVLAVSIVLIVINKQQKVEQESPSDTSGAIIDADNFTPDKINAPLAPAPSGTTVKPLNAEETMQNAVKQIAKIFVERYGTYSSDNNFNNINEVEVISSPDLWKVLSKRITVTQVNEEFVGMTTKAVVVAITVWQTDKATVEINTIRTETKNGVSSSKNQIAVVKLINVQDSWLVDDIKWIQ